MTSPRGKRPCVIPQVQIDTWGQRGAGSARYTCAELAAELFGADRRLVGWSLLRSKSASTVARIAQCIRMIHSPFCPSISAGQIYLRPDWRVRWADMSPRLQDMVLQADYSPATLHDAFHIYYKPDTFIADIYNLIGPARSAGVQSMLSLPSGESLVQ